MKTFAEEERKFFEGYEIYGSRKHQYARHRAVLDSWRRVNVGTILDVGCGYGDLVPMIQVEFPKFVRYQGVDVTPRCIHKAIATCTDDRCHFQEGTVFDISLVYDAVAAIGIFSKNTDDWEGLVAATIEKMWQQTKRVMSFTTMHPCMWEVPDTDRVCDERQMLSWILELPNVAGFQLQRVDPEYVNIATVYRKC